MTDREKLIELIDKGTEDIGEPQMDDIYELADYLLENGVIVLPFKRGDIVWRIEDVWYLSDGVAQIFECKQEVVEYIVRSISISCNSSGNWNKRVGVCMVRNGRVINNQRYIDFKKIGKTLFLTKEEAEKALAKRNKEK